jgi:hypothetical protein
MDEQKAAARKNGESLPERRLLSRAAVGLLAVLLLNLPSCRKDPPTPEEISQANNQLLYFLLGIAFLIIAIYLFRRLLAYKQLKIQRAEASLKNSLDSLQPIGTLLDILYSPNPQNLDEAVNGLVSLLPKLQLKDVGLLKSRQRSLLLRTLSHPDQRLVYASLAALEQIGDQHSLRAIEQLERTTTDDKLRLSAANCRTAITAREDLSSSQKTLLRPAANIVEPAEMLLRAAQGTPTGDAAQLLRGSSGEPSGGIDPRD